MSREQLLRCWTEHEASRTGRAGAPGLDVGCWLHGLAVGQIVPPPQKKDISTQNLWMQPYLEKGSLQLQLRMLRWDYSGLGWALNPKTGVLLREGRGRSETQRHRERRPCGDGGRDIGVMLTQAKEFWNRRILEPPMAGRVKEGFSLRALRVAWHLDFRLLVSKMKRMNFCCFRPPGLWEYYRSPRTFTQSVYLVEIHQAVLTICAYLYMYIILLKNVL